eukprot:TRINITY_DN61587_c0_g1_i1.p1 TRINITY_DN61587_c0_g1~~TRINITY_DN61587_c0_g1_i1.p1  ORF type:complete len:129 (+),score=35.60 TRINITY_DN61587_c0_g1_i1:96-482(+)
MEAVLDGVPSFCGDGQYKGDGGVWLQRLWDALQWKEIRGCPGRYTLPKGAENTTPHSDVLLRIGYEGGVLRERSAGCADTLLITLLPGGGGLMSYAKPDGVTFVHTLNTASGLKRKLTALSLEHVLPG